MILVTRKENFNAAHRLYNKKWSDEKNLEVFGKCSNPNWHGHNFELFVTIVGPLNEDTGFVVDMKDLGAVVRKHIIDKIDHKNLNLDVDFMKDKIPTAENLSMAIWNELTEPVSGLGVKLYSIVIKESGKNSVEYRG